MTSLKKESIPLSENASVCKKLEVKHENVTNHNDTIIINKLKHQKSNHGLIISGARPIPPVSYGNTQEYIDSQFGPNIYIEENKGFSAKSIQFLTNTQKEYNNSNEDYNIPYEKNVSEITKNPGLNFVFLTHKGLRKFSEFIFGLFAGALLAHTLYIQSLGLSTTIGANNHIYYTNDDGLLLLKHYGIYARPIAFTFYISLMIIGVLILDKVDLGLPTQRCMQRCVQLQNFGIAILFYFAALAINSSMTFPDYYIHLIGHKTQSEILAMINGTPNVVRYIKIWKILDASRTAFILTSWLIYSISNSQYNRLLLYLVSHPIENKGQEKLNASKK